MIRAIVVIYNKRIEDSLTYKSIKNIDNDKLEVLFVDNSEHDFNNKQYCDDNNINYCSMNGNKGLSKAYNKAIDMCDADDVVVLLDDDTEIKFNYFDVLIEALNKEKDVDIFAPIVYGQDGVIYSPNEFNFLRNHFISDSSQKVSQDKFNAIASCLAIRMSVFKNYRFNEKLFVDQVDQFFFCEQRKLGRKFGILNIEINQNFYQRDALLDPDAGWRRLKLRIFDIMRHARLMGGGLYILLGFIKCCGLGVQIGKKCKSVNIFFNSVCLSTKLLFKDI